MRSAVGLLVTALVPALVRCYAPTDSIQDADGPQSGYLPNHNMDPNVVASSSFGILWQQQMSSNAETWYAKPLVYTLADGAEMVITASNMNNVRIHDAKAGTLIASRQLTAPFLQSDIGCADIPNYIGVTGTPIIDPATDIIYMFAKGYRNGAASGGIANGVYQMYALKLPSLADAPGFPLMLDGYAASNDQTRYFLGGTVLQRPSLTSLNGVIIAAFGGHCDLFNYTGMVAAISKTPGVGVVSLFATESSPGAPTPQPLTITQQSGGKAGIWQSGMGLATDSNRVFGVTGNGQGHANGNVPASGRLPLSTLDECVINFGVSSNGNITLNDYFEPYDYVNMDAGDKDLGSSGACLLDSSTFKTSTVNRIAVVVGKNSKVYVLNADNLGGFKQGSGGSDNVLQTITASNSVFGGAGSYPLEGGYFYFTPVGDYTYAYRFGVDSLGAPFFTQAGQTPTKSTGRAGVGQPTVTTFGGKAGTAILWITDVGSGLQAFSAVPDGNGVLKAINLPATPGINKYQRPAFGNGRVFVTANNKIIALGAPVNLPLNCSSPIDLGSLQTGDTRDATVTCTANIAISNIQGCSTDDPLWQCKNSSLPTGALAQGASFQFPITWDLTDKSIKNLVNSSYAKVMPGVESTVLSLYTTNAVKGYTTLVPISLTGQVVSKSPYLFVSPGHVDFGGLVLGSPEAANGLTGSVSVQNIGNSTMTITGISWTADINSVPNNATFNGSSVVFGNGFSATGFPAPGSTLEAGGSVSVPLFFNTSLSGSYTLTITVYSDGGVDDVLLAASSGNPPIASIEVSTLEGWDNSVPTTMAFGTVLSGSTATRQIRICNSGGSVLTITKSKPPQSSELTATKPYGDLLEGQKIDAGACAYGTVAVYAAPLQPNHPSHFINLSWTLNTDGLSALDPSQQFEVHDVSITVTIVSRQVGPLQSGGSGLYQWVGCFLDTGRNLATSINNAAQQATNTIEQCQTLCKNAGYALAGTQYQKECWCGNTIKNPNSYTNDSLNLCTFACTGDTTESCGGDGTYMSMYADVTRFNISDFLLNRNSSATTPSANTPAAPSNISSAGAIWQYAGCYKDNVNNQRTLKTANTAADTVTLESCAAFCSNYNFFGTEYGRECYCGYTLNVTLKTSEADCSTSCAGNSTEICGSGARLSVYNNTIYHAPPPDPVHIQLAGQYNWIGCYSEATKGRALSAYNYASDSMTVEICAAFCASKGTLLMGIEYARECYCGNSLGAGSQLGAASNCNMLCKNNTLEYCGAGGNLDLYTLQLSTSSSSSVSITFTGLSSSLSSPSPVVLSTMTITTTASSSVVLSSSSSSSSVVITSPVSTGLATSSSSVPQSPSSSNSPLTSSTLTDAIGTSSTPSSTSSSLTSGTSSSVPNGGFTSSTSSTVLSTSSSSSNIALASSSSLLTATSSIMPQTTSSTPSITSQSSTSSYASSLSLSTSSIPFTPATTTATLSTTSTSSSKNTAPTPTATNGYYLIGCFSDTSAAHALPQLFANKSMTPELCINYANSVYQAATAAKPTTTRMPYLFLEYHGECYGGSSFNFRGSAVTSLVGTKACKSACYGSATSVTSNGVVKTTTLTDNMCGGGRQFNLYALSTTVTFPTTGGPVITKST